MRELVEQATVVLAVVVVVLLLPLRGLSGTDRHEMVARTKSLPAQTAFVADSACGGRWGCCCHCCCRKGALRSLLSWIGVSRCMQCPSLALQLQREVCSNIY